MRSHLHDVDSIKPRVCSKARELLKGQPEVLGHSDTLGQAHDARWPRSLEGAEGKAAGGEQLAERPLGGAALVSPLTVGLQRH